ncbi:MAG: Gfo/Idh/MocA family protein, partial [bacterium]
MQKIKLGIIGTGLAAEILHWPALKKLQDRIEISAVCNRTLEKAIKFAKLVGCQSWYSDYKEMLTKEDLHAVLVCTPIFLNYPITEACVKAGKHVLCEKPPGVNLEEAQKMVTLSQNADQTILIGENYYYRDDLNKAQELLEAGKIGNLFLIRIETMLNIDANQSWTSRKWRIEPAHRGGIVSDAGVHHMAAFRMFAGEVVELSGFELDVYPEVKDSDNLLLNLRFKNHVLGQYTATYTAVAQHSILFRMAIYGDKGSIFITDGRLEIFSEG